MQMVLTWIAGARSPDHRAVFGEFARGLAKVLRRPPSRARVRTVEG